MAQWRVYNMHPDGLTHTEKFKDDLLVIKAGEFILMDYEDAVQFKGNYFPVKLDAMGKPTRETFKVIKIVPDNSKESADIEKSLPKKFICNMDGKQFASQTELDVYTKENYGHLIFKDEALEEQIEKRT